MFFIVWGTRALLLTIGSGVFLCPQCKTPQQFRHREYKKFFTLYYIPLIPLESLQSFVECKCCKQKFRSALLTMPNIQIKYQNNYPVLTAYLTVIALIVGLILVVNVGTALGNHQIAAARESAAATKTALINTFGKDTFSICGEETIISRDFSPVPDAHYLVANRVTYQVMSEVYGQLPESMRARSPQDLTYVLCMQEFSGPDGEREEYGKDVTVYSCQRYRHSWTVDVYEVKTRSIVGKTTIYGPHAPLCPEKTNKDVLLYGDDPNFNQVVNWIQSSAK